MTTLFKRQRYALRVTDRGLRTRHDWRRHLIRLTAAASALAALALAMSWAEDTLAALDDAQTKAITASYKVSHLERTWVSCLENKAVWVGDELHTCSLLNTRFSKGDFK